MDEQEQAADDRCHVLEVGDDETVIYDRRNHQAWIQSDISIDPEDFN